MAITVNALKGLRMINTVIIGEDLISAKALNYEPDMQVNVVEPAELELLMAQVATHKPNIIVVDDTHEKLNVDILSYVCATRCPDAQVIVLTENSPDFQMLQSTGFKVRAYVSREQRPLLAKAVRVVNDGEAWLPRKLVAEMLDYFSAEVGLKSLPDLKLVNS